MSSSARYLVVLLGLCGTVLGVFLTLNLALGQRGLGSPEATRLASEWQQASKGVTYAPPIVNTRSFKVLRMTDRLPGINGMVLGSSTLMGLEETMFPAPMRVYNFSTTANPTAHLVAEAEYLVLHHAREVKWLLLGLDWSIGMVYHRIAVPPLELTPAAALATAPLPNVPLHSKLADALSYPKVLNLLKALLAIARAPDPLRSFQRTFFDIASDPYRCPEGTFARDFDVVNRGICLGFRYDGSWTFAAERRLTPARAMMLARAAAAPSSKFSRFLCETGGEPNPLYLDRLAALVPRYARQGGRIVFILPPMIPGMEVELQKGPETRKCLERTKAKLSAWSREHRVTVIDAGASERFGCEPGEFLDEHHAFAECHQRIFSRFWRDAAAGRVGPGLYHP